MKRLNLVKIKATANYVVSNKILSLTGISSFKPPTRPAIEVLLNCFLRSHNSPTSCKLGKLYHSLSKERGQLSSNVENHIFLVVLQLEQVLII